MSTMLQTIEPKTDQLNADSLIGGSITIKVTKVSIVMGEQPVSINYEGDNGKPYKPGKSMRRILVNCWGSDVNNYVGRSMTLYRDDKVKFGGVDVGGIRISHLSHIEQPVTMALTATKAVRKPFTVKPLVIAPAAPAEIDHALELLKRNARDNALNGATQLKTWFEALPTESKRLIKPSMDAEYKQLAEKADKAAGEATQGETKQQENV